jgi:hypothetical protein
MRNLFFISIIIAFVADSLAGAQAQNNADGTDESAPPVIDVTAVDYAYAAPDTIPAGWVTFRMTNKGQESHHFHLNRLPEGRSYADFREAFKKPADSLMHLVDLGKLELEQAEAAIDSLAPDWAEEIQTKGGVGLVSPGRTGKTTHIVKPGHYVVVCVINAPNERIHASLGMVDGIVAVDSSVKGSTLKADATVKGVENEIYMDDTVSSGKQTVGFNVKRLPKNLRSGTDGYFSVWAAHLEDSTNLNDIAKWDFTNPAPYESLGGFEYLPPNQTAYITTDFKPGRYAWIWFYEGMDLGGNDTPLVKEFIVK